MSETKHTPGEWIADGRTVYVLDDLTGVNRWSCHIGGHLATEAEMTACAKVMAAAPDLLKAAKRALAVMKATNGQAVLPGNALGALSAAITKATGVQS